MTSCLICNNDFAQINEQGFNIIHNCKQCGSYLTSKVDVPRFDDKLRSIISGYVRENQPNHKHFHLTQEVIAKISRMPLSTIDEKIIKLMRWMEKQTSYFGESIKTNLNDHPELVAICYAKNINEVGYFIEYLKEKNFVSINASNQNRITIEGFKYLESEKKKINSDLCFCAMSFNPEHKYIYDEFIQPAANIAGYRIKRVDEDPHNEGVVDKIFALIRQSKFVISDLTGSKNGVYYEAGWAKRGEQDVIFTCEESDFEKVHFDIQHLNLLKWSRNNIDQAIEKLKWRIEGTIGRGSFSQESL